MAASIVRFRLKIVNETDETVWNRPLITLIKVSQASLRVGYR